MSIKNKCAVFLLALALPACAATDLTTTSNGDVFASRVASSDKLEIQSSEFALKQSSSSAVQQIAQKMIDDHTRSDQDLMMTLSSNDLPMPQPILLPYHQRMLDELEGSDDVDCVYVGGLATAHEQAIALVDSYATYGDTAALRQYAARTLPKLEEHLKMIEKTKGAVQCGPQHHTP